MYLMLQVHFHYHENNADIIALIQ